MYKAYPLFLASRHMPGHAHCMWNIKPPPIRAKPGKMTFPMTCRFCLPQWQYKSLEDSPKCHASRKTDVSDHCCQKLKGNSYHGN